MTKYSDIVADLEYKVAAGIASPTEISMAEAIGIEPPTARKGYTQMSYKNGNGNGNGSTGASHKSITAAQASDGQPMDPHRAQALAGAFKSIGIDTAGLERRLSSGMPQTQIDELVRLLNTFLWPAPGAKTPAPVAQGSQPARTLGNSKSSGGAGASSSIRPSGGPKAMANPPRNQAAQKSYDDPYLESAQMLTRGFFRPGPNRTPTR